MVWVAIVASVGVCAGVAAGLLGVGGGFIIVPALLYLFESGGVPLDFAMPLALGTSLAAIVPASLASGVTHYRLNNVNPGQLKSLSIPTAFGAFAGAISAPHLGGKSLTVFFGLLALALSLKMAVTTLKPDAFGSAKRISLAVAKPLFFVTGFASAVAGIGGGSFNVPPLSRMGNSIHRSVGTAAAVGFAVSLPAAAGYLIAGVYQTSPPPFSTGFAAPVGFVDPFSLALLVPTMMIAAPMGAKLSTKLNPKILRSIFAVFLATVAVRLLTR